MDQHLELLDDLDKLLELDLPLRVELEGVQEVVDELPKLKQEVAARTTQVETKMSMELGEMRETLTTRLQAAEKELNAKANSADLRAVQLELEEQANP